MATYSIPSSPSVSSYTTEIFRGVDYTNEEGNVSNYQSPNAPNMVRDVVGKVRKSMGWYEYEDFSRFGRINGRYKLSTDDYELLHIGTKLIIYNPTDSGAAAAQKDDISNGGYKIISSAMNDHKSHAWQMTYTGIASIDGDSDNGNAENCQVLVIQDGRTLWIYDGSSFYTAASKAYVPTLTIGKSPTGGGYDYESINLLGTQYKERFIADGTATYYMTLGFTSVAKVEIRATATGVWRTCGSDYYPYTVNATNGTVTFNTAPAKVDLNGEDNVRITVNKSFTGYADRINKCTLGIQYGINGVPDRLFVGGNPDNDLLNYDWFCGQNDPTYWGDLNYCTVGNNGSKIVGYAIVNNLLAAFKDELDENHSVVLRTSNLSTATVSDIEVMDVTFPTYNTLQGDSCVASDSISYLNNEPLFLTEQGIYALSSNDVSGDRYHQNRSFYINGKLNKVIGKKDAVAVTFNDQYILCAAGELFILDGLQSLTSSGDPYSTRQYACFNRLNVNARVMWVEDYKLYFGTENGKLCAFYTDDESLISYTDGARRNFSGEFPTKSYAGETISVDYSTGDPYKGTAIQAIWETNDIVGSKFYKYKKFKYFSLCVKAFARSHVRIDALVNGRWEKVLENDTSSNSFKFTSFSFADLLFSSGIGSTIFYAKYKRKKVDRLRFKIQNNEYYQPLGMHNWGCEFVEKGNYKG